MGATRKTGIWLAKPTAPSSSPEPVRRYTSHDWATVCIHVPIREMSCPLKKSWKLRWRSARPAACQLSFAAGGVCPDFFCLVLDGNLSFQPRSVIWMICGTSGTQYIVRFKNGPKRRQFSRETPCSFRRDSGTSTPPSSVMFGILDEVVTSLSAGSELQ